MAAAPTPRRQPARQKAKPVPDAPVPSLPQPCVRLTEQPDTGPFVQPLHIPEVSAETRENVARTLARVLASQILRDLRDDS
jgi:hypothetical protein